MRNENFSSVGAQAIDTSGYQVFYLDDVAFDRENDQLDVDALLRPGIDTPFPLQSFNDFHIGAIVENPTLIDEQQDKENSPPPHPTTPVSERPTQPPVLMRNRQVGKTIENDPDYLYRNLFY